ncbi:MAG: hypothetical protein V2A71_08230 [Candidatus Eisenbacteria bacterium]
MVRSRVHRRARLAAVLGVLGALAAVALIASCGERDRLNPLDPLNDATGGRPPSFNAVALDGRVELRWAPLRLKGLSGLNVYRGTRESGPFELLAGSPLDPGGATAVDSSVVNGTTYFYVLVPVIESAGERTPSLPVAATPGPHMAVVCDGWSGVVSKLSADLRTSIWTVGGFYLPFCVASSGTFVLVCDLYEGVMKLDSEGGLVWRAAEFTVPVWVSVHTDGTSAVADYAAGNVTILSPDGHVERVMSEALLTPRSVSFDSEGNVWVADPGAGRVNKYSREGLLVSTNTNLVRPSVLDVEMESGCCWVADGGTNSVVRLSPEAEEMSRITLFSSPRAVEAEQKGGGCWVAACGSKELVRLSAGAGVQWRVGKMGCPVWIHASPDDGSVWVADAELGRVLVLSGAGHLRFVTSQFVSPMSLTVPGNVR